jgi:peptidoglycan/xylan/chitin deacetylase (PgdA/CDA1 family)
VEVAVIVDDLPVLGASYRGVGGLAIVERMLSTFQRHGLPPVRGFVNAKKVDDAPETEAILRRWVAAGNPLGNHTYSHLSLETVEVSAYLADVEKGEPLLEKVQPGAWKVFSYPDVYEGETVEKYDAVRAFLDARGYAVAEVTISADDWAYNAPLRRCSERGDTAGLSALRRDLVATHAEELDRVRAITRSLAQREVRQVLLLHVGAATADALDDLLTAYEQRGVRWIDLRAALSDPFYASNRRLAYSTGAPLPYLVAKARGLTVPPPVSSHDVQKRLDRLCH